MLERVLPLHSDNVKLDRLHFWGEERVEKEESEEREEGGVEASAEKGESAAEAEEEPEKETKGEKRASQVAYQNVGNSIEATNVLLERGRQAGWDYIFMADAWEGKKGERTRQQGYRTFSQRGSKIALYVREEVELAGTKVEVNESWISIGNEIMGVYLRPNIHIETLRRQLLEIPPTDNIIGDLNCTPRYKQRSLLEDMD